MGYMDTHGINASVNTEECVILFDKMQTSLSYFILHSVFYFVILFFTRCESSVVSM